MTKERIGRAGHNRGAHRPAVVAQAGQQRAQHERQVRAHRVGLYLGRQLRDARACSLPHGVVVSLGAAHVVLHHLPSRDDMALRYKNYPHEQVSSTIK
jgi:hypothetical protein